MKRTLLTLAAIAAVPLCGCASESCNSMLAPRDLIIQPFALRTRQRPMLEEQEPARVYYEKVRMVPTFTREAVPATRAYDPCAPAVRAADPCDPAVRGYTIPK